MSAASARGGSPEAVNVAFWGQDAFLADYRNRVLKPAEVTILLRFHDRFSRRVMEIGCGAGRLLGYIAEIADEAHGIDVSPSMVRYCRQRFPRALVAAGDLRQLSVSLEGTYDAVLAADNLLDILDDARRRAVLAVIRDHLSSDGVLVFSSHNLDATGRAAPRSPGGVAGAPRLGRRILSRSPKSFPSDVKRLRRRRANRRRLKPMELRTDGYAVINDEAHDYSLLHYYTRHSAQVAQLSETGLRLVECLDLEGSPVTDDRPDTTTSLYYVAAPIRTSR